MPYCLLPTNIALKQLDGLNFIIDLLHLIVKGQCLIKLDAKRFWPLFFYTQYIMISIDNVSGLHRPT